MLSAQLVRPAVPLVQVPVGEGAALLRGLGWGGSRAGRVHKLRSGVLVGVGSPESLGTTGIELGHWLGELLTIFTFNSADLEDSSRTPVLTALGASLWWHQWWAELLHNIDLECTGGRVASIIISNVGDLVGTPVQ